MFTWQGPPVVAKGPVLHGRAYLGTAGTIDEMEPGRDDGFDRIRRDPVNLVTQSETVRVGRLFSWECRLDRALFTCPGQGPR